MNYSKIKVANILEEGRFGGPQARVVSVSQGLIESFIETTVIFPRIDSEKLKNILSKSNVNSIEIDITRLSKERRILFRYVTRFIKEVFMIYRLIKKNNFNIIHVNGSYQIKGAISGKLAGIPVIWHLNDTKMNTIVRIIFKFISKFCASGYIFASDKVHSYYKNFISSKKIFSVINAPVDTSIFDPSKVEEDEIISDNNSPIVTTVSNINPGKGIEEFIIMASALEKIYSKIRFFIVGPIYKSQIKYFSKLKNLLMRYHINNISFLGSVDNVASILKSTTVFVFLSRSEASPTSVWEAMSMELPVIATDVGDVRKYIKNGKNGFVVPVGNVYEIVEKVSLLINNKKLRNVIGKNARKTATKYFDLKHCVYKHKIFYRELNRRHIRKKDNIICR